MSLASTYDRDADALYLRLGAPRATATTRVFEPGVIADFDANGQIVGVEFLDASTRLSADALTGIDEPVEWLSLIDAGALANLSPGTLRVQLRNGRLTGEKRGRDWVVARHVILSYVDEVEHAETTARPQLTQTQRSGARNRRSAKTSEGSPLIGRREAPKVKKA